MIRYGRWQAVQETGRCVNPLHFGAALIAAQESGFTAYGGDDAELAELRGR